MIGAWIPGEELREALGEDAVGRLLFELMVKHGILIELRNDRYGGVAGVVPDGPEWAAVIRDLEAAGAPRTDTEELRSSLPQKWPGWPLPQPRWDS
jgi:hypothetical protein